MAGWETGAYDAMLPRASVPARRQTVSDGTVTLLCSVPSHGMLEIRDLRGPPTELRLRLPGLREPVRVPLEPEARPRTEVALQCPQPTGVVVWTVVDARGEPVAGAHVTVGAWGQPSWSVRADGDGRAQLAVFGDGVESVRVGASGFEARTLTERDALRGGRVALRASPRTPTSGR